MSIRINGHHLLSLVYYTKNHQIKSDHGLLFNFKTKKLFGKIVLNPHQQIQIVDSFDDICEYCKQQHESCPNPSYNRAFIQMAELETGKLYCAHDILQKLERSRDIQKLAEPVGANISGFVLDSILSKYGYSVY